MKILMNERDRLHSLAQTIKDHEAKIVRLKIMRKKALDNPSRKFTIEESIRTTREIRERLIEAYWRD